MVASSALIPQLRFRPLVGVNQFHLRLRTLYSRSTSSLFRVHDQIMLERTSTDFIKRTNSLRFAARKITTMSLPASGQLSLTNLSEETRSIYKPVLKDFMDFYSETIHFMSYPERDTCQLVLDSVAIPPNAWEEPEHHPLSAVAIERREACLPTLYMLKLVYMGHYLTLISRYGGIRCTDPGILAIAFFVRLRFKDSPATKLAVQVFGTEIIWLARNRVPHKFICVRLQCDSDGGLVEEDGQSHDHIHNNAVLRRLRVSVPDIETNLMTSEYRELKSGHGSSRLPSQTTQHWALSFEEGQDVATLEDTDVEEEELINDDHDGNESPDPLRSIQIGHDSDDQTLVGEMYWVSNT